MINIILYRGIVGILIGMCTIPFFQNRCKSSQKHIDGKLNSIMVFSSIPLVDLEDGEINVLVDSFYIYNYGDNVLYQIPEIYLPRRTTIDTNGNVINREFLESEIKFHYWLFKSGDSVGLRFDTLGSNTGTRFDIDSLIDSKTSFKQGISLDSYQLIEKITDPLNNFFSEKYIPKVKSDSSPDTSTLYFSNDFNDVGFSFAKALDLQKKSKLYKFRIIFNPIPKGKYAFDVPKRELLLEIRKPAIKNAEQILELFKNFERATN